MFPRLRWIKKIRYLRMEISTKLHKFYSLNQILLECIYSRTVRLSDKLFDKSMYPHLSEDEHDQKYSTPNRAMQRGIPAPAELYPPPYVQAQLRSHRLTGGGMWSTGLCHCCDDPANSFITCCCPCITFGQIAEILDKGTPDCATHGAIYGLILVTGCACLYSCFYRSKMRAHYDLQESPCVDCLVHFCCEACALCQEYRELKSRGLDMGIGWEANIERQRRGTMTSPVIPQGMSR